MKSQNPFISDHRFISRPNRKRGKVGADSAPTSETEHPKCP